MNGKREREKGGGGITSLYFMPSSIRAPTRTLHHLPLAQSSFAAFGTVVENPAPELTVVAPDGSFDESASSRERRGADSKGTLISSPSTASPAPTQYPSTPQVVSANQNTALKYLAVSPLTNLYDQSPSQTPGRTTMNLFACFPRVLTPTQDGESLVFKIRVLERHPFTTQTFVPMGLAAADPSTKYLVIVAPTIGPTQAFSDRGPPDLVNLHAFMAHGGQAVTYAAGTWHAPMVVVGRSKVDFFVVQFCNGVPAEDCEEAELEGEGFGVVVDLPA